jgi:hypothetical protein
VPRETIPGVLDMQCNYTPGQNSGRVASSTDGILGETVTYSYDPLNRLFSARSVRKGDRRISSLFAAFGGKCLPLGSSPKTARRMSLLAR